MKTHSLLIAVLCLTACSPQPSDKVDSASASSEAAPVIVSSAAPVSSIAAAVTTLPSGFVGKWDEGPKPCGTSYRSQMQLDIAATEMSFFESGGTVKSVKVTSPTDIVAEVAMAGEGDTWTSTMHMVLTDDGKTLTIDEGKAGIRTRCA